MSSAAPNARRRAARPTDPDMTPSLLDAFQNMSIRKGDTFHPNTDTSKSDFWDPLESSSSMTVTRSTTSPKALEDLLIGAGERRVANLLERVDKAIAAQSKVALSNVLSEPEVLPVPTVDDENTEESHQKSRTRIHSHSSDSGLGSSVADSVESTESTSTSTARNSVHTATGDKQSLSSISNASDEERGLSKYAAEQIHKHIVEPILKEESLKEFHGLIKSVPSRIGDKEIKTLRELEKTLIFLAPDYSRSPSKYLRFCERTIRVLHTTVTTIHESDQRAPADRPYTQGYFFELVDQIRRYATILAATRAKQAKGEKLGPMDITEGERVSIHGGMSHNGQPAELVRNTTDGKVISITRSQALTEEELASSSAGPMQKRPAEDLDDDDATRSMARRKKNAKPEIHTCELCEKEFKRPCDLTKHVKTHERPWKCPQDDCKYFEYGWPTEKERDRHVNDKHSDAPSLYHCLYKPCPYTSKRESNCKQHMEKAHGWNYVRSKSNGKGRGSNAVRLPQGSVPPSPASAMLTPLTNIAPSPSMGSISEASRRGSMAPPSTTGSSNYGTPGFGQPSPDFAGHFNMNNMNFDFNDMVNFPMSGFPITPATSEDLASVSSHSGALFDVSSFDNGSPNDFTFDDFKFDNFDFSSYTPGSSIAGPSSGVGPQASPAHMDQTFTNDAMNIDDSYPTYTSGPNQDFTLFGATAPATSGDMFPSLPAEGTWGNLDQVGSNFGSHFDVNNNTTTATAATTTNDAPMLPTGNSTLEDLFPELKNQR